MERVYKGLMGWQASDEKHVGTHVLMESDEYSELVREIQSLKNELACLERDSKAEREALYKSAINKLKSQKEEYEAQIDEYKQSYANEKNLRKEAERLNINLKRICRENANAKRGIKPKKEHNGFIVTATGEIFERVKYKKDMLQYRAYKSIIETPYNEIFPLANDLKSMAWEDGLNEIFDSAWTDSNSVNYLGAINEKNKDKNFIYKQNWRTNKNGFWEIECYHTKPIRFFDEDIDVVYGNVDEEE